MNTWGGTGGAAPAARAEWVVSVNALYPSFTPRFVFLTAAGSVAPGPIVQEIAACQASPPIL